MWNFWIDRGGTFTDIVASNSDGQLISHKLLSENPEQYQDAVVQGIRDIMQLKPNQPIPPQSIDTIKMGTTVATNALLERKGEPTLLLITEGFGDLLRIGYQNRPRIFDLNIQLPQLLYQHVSEIRERMDCHGNIIKPLDLKHTLTQLKKAYDQKIRSVAIVYMHSYLNPEHEQITQKLAADIGFKQISVSHQVSPLIKLIGRGDTTVVDAYLSPILRHYVNQLREAIDVKKGTCKRIFFMQSNGGLIDALSFKGKDSILSGPAGGVVGMVKTANQAGFEKIIGFDMGGTSTDVCHYAGRYERSFETEIAGVRILTPMMDIHTVAAGGGSILSFKGGRYQVGPESAGANPGPACYRRGGPLCVSDCNVVLGKIHPDHFPALFGPQGDETLDANIVRQKFAQLAQKIASETKQKPLSIEETAEGFLKIAVENMATAIKKISIDRGYDITRYTLNCFGGAGGQHACLVADTLGIKKIFIHPFAGVLSALGMGYANIRVLKEKQFEQPIEAVGQALKILKQLEGEAKNQVVSQGIETNAIKYMHRAYLRYAGSHQTLEVSFDTQQNMQQQFKQEHIARFGFASPKRDLIFDMLCVEAIGYSASGHLQPLSKNQNPSPPVYVDAYFEKRKQKIPLYTHLNLPLNNAIKGPAIIVDANSTTIVEPGWQGTLDQNNHLILERYQKLPLQKAIGTNADPIMLEVFNNLFMSIAEQMGITLAKTAHSVNIKERLDFSCALFDHQGALVANAPHLPVHLGSMGESVRIVAQLNKGKIKPNDSFMLNAPFNGGTHLPDITVITPVFDQHQKQILFYVGSRGHHADIGGKTPGSAPPDSRHIEEEGVVIDNFKLVDNGHFLETKTRKILASGRYPCRNIDQNIADLEAQIAANKTGIKEIHKMINMFGLDTIQAYMQHIQLNSQQSIREVIKKLKNSQFTYPLDNGLKIQVNIILNDQKNALIVDFTGTSPQDSGNYNAPLSVCHAAVLYVFRTLVNSNIPLNQGCMKAINIIAPEGSIVNPLYPAAVISGNTEISQAITDCLYGALGVIAASQGTMNNFVWGNESFQNYETICGGTGAGPDFNGCDAVQSHMTNTRMTDPEILEKRFPVRLEKFAIRPFSGGEGKYKGGNGVHRQLRFLEPVTATILSSHRIIPPFGVNGGKLGACGKNTVIRKDGSIVELSGNDQCQLETGDIFEILTPGGGGFGA
ncbi:MAG: hydantoinase B/oxoprolinase family protein [Pseudomonadota bacterium]